MRDVKMTDVIRRSAGRTSTILFRPFNLKKWLVLVFIGLFAGAISLGNNNSGGGKSGESRKSPGAGSGTAVSQSVSGASQQAGQSTGTARTPASPQQLIDGAKKALQSKAVLAVVISIILFVVMFYILGVWVGSHFKFIWFNAIAANDASIVEPFHRNRVQGQSFFIASLVISLLFLAAIVAIIGWGVSLAYSAGAFEQGFTWSADIAMRIFTSPIIALIVVLFIGIILYVAIENFVVMVMAMDKASFMTGLNKVAGIYKGNIGDIILFHFVLLGLAIACGILAMIITLVVSLLVLLLGLLIFGGGYVLLVAAIKLPIAFVIYCIILGIPFLGAGVLMLFCLQLPFAVFLRSFGIEYLLSLNCGYTYEKLADYAKVRSPERSRAIVVVPVILICLVTAVFILGLLAAIAIPNFIRAREAALKSRESMLQRNSMSQQAGPASSSSQQ